jgi:hypothetical protein
MITAELKRKLRYRYLLRTSRASWIRSPEVQELEAIRVIASLDDDDVLDLARPESSRKLTDLIREITYDYRTSGRTTKEKVALGGVGPQDT